MLNCLKYIQYFTCIICLLILPACSDFIYNMDDLALPEELITKAYVENNRIIFEKTVPKNQHNSVKIISEQEQLSENEQILLNRLSLDKSDDYEDKRNNLMDILN